MPAKRRKPARKRSKSKSATAASKKPAKRKLAVKSKTAKKPPKRKAVPKHAASGARGSRKKNATVSPEREIKQDLRTRRLPSTGMAGRQSGDLQGLSRAEQADSESVDELIGEGNVFEASAVAGVEEADNADEREVHTRELPEDDVPEEYRDEKS